MSSTPNPLDNIPSLHPHTTLHSPSPNTRAWSSRAHPSSATPLLATAASDKSVHVWDMRDWRLLSTISGGHKRSVRCVGWKDYGRKPKRTRTDADAGTVGGQEEGEGGGKQDPVILATGSFDANCGLWVWNQERNTNNSASEPSQQQARTVPGSFDEDMETAEQDFTHTNVPDEADENEEWHFSTLLTGPDSEIKDLQFSPPHYGANLLATCSRDKSVWVWEEVEAEEWETVAVLGEHTGDVKCLGWCGGVRTTRAGLRRRLRRRQDKGNADADVGGRHEEAEEEEIVLGGRELLASGSYDDTIRLHHDDEAEGDWITIAVMTGHEGTVWDLRFESHVNLASYPNGTSEEEVIADWEPRLVSCSDDLTVRVWRKELSEKEREEKRTRIAEAKQGQGQGQASPANGEAAPPQTGFASSRLPSVIRPPTSTEKWIEEARLPAVHVRSIYALDWSTKTGLIVTCGGDGLIAVYQEVAAATTATATGQDVVMNGTAEHQGDQDEAAAIQKLKTEWRVIAAMEAAHDEYEINHVCWAPVRDQRRQLDAGEVVGGGERDDEEYIVSTGDEGNVRVWRLPGEVLDQVRQDV